MGESIWGSGGAYEPYVGRWSRQVAEVFVPWLGQPPSLRWLDVGCGTGALTAAILRYGTPRSVLGVEPSFAYLRHAAAHIPDGSAAFVRADAGALPLAPDAVDVTVSGLVLNFVPDLPLTLGEMRRVTAGEGMVAAYVWDYADGMRPIRLFWDAAVALDPPSAALDEGRRFPLCRPDALCRALCEAGYVDVEQRTVDISAHFRDFADYWEPFLGGQGPAPTYCGSLSGEQRTRLRGRLHDMVRERYGDGDGDGLTMPVRAFAVKARAA